MLRYAAAFAAVLLASMALADGIDPSRDANLALLKNFCTFVSINSDNHALTQMKPTLVQDLLDRATLYSVPLHSSCQGADNFLSLFVTAVNVSTTNNGFLVRLGVEVDNGSSVYKLPTVWEDMIIVTGPKAQLPDYLERDTKKLFDQFALAWKKQRKQ